LHMLRGEEVMQSTLRAQYGAGKVDGKQIAPYTEHEGVAKNSKTETLLAIRRELAEPIRGDSVRISPHLYNDESDIEKFFAVLRKLI